MKNQEVAKILLEISGMLSLSNENTFRIKAYERAAKAIESLTLPIEDFPDKDKLKAIPGIGEGIASKIEEYLSGGSIKYLDELRKKYPEGLLEIIGIPGMGPGKAKILFEELKISNLKELKEYAKKGKLKGLPGFGEKTEENVLRGIDLKERSKGRILLSEALDIFNSIAGQLKEQGGIKHISPAGSLRRRKETIGDIDILCAVDKGKEKNVVDKFISLPITGKVIASGGTKATIISRNSFQVDLRVVGTSQLGSALQYFTGSKEHNVRIRELALKKGMTINEYGLFRVSDKSKPVASRSEKDIYCSLGMQFVPPELREDRGEIEAAMKKELPELLEESDIRGDTHIHTNYSDGDSTIAQMADKARERGLEWAIICDHSQSLKIAGGLNEASVRKKMREIRDYNSRHKDITLLCGSEVDILSDGKLDYDDSLLKELDFVIASIHTGFRQPEEQLTMRVKKAMENRYVNCIAHPTGRLLNQRAEYRINMQSLLENAKKNDVMIEINAFPERLDLSDVYCRKAKEMGLTMAIGSDAHAAKHLDYLTLGVYTARRGWLGKKDVINTLSYNELKKRILLKR